jgi:hypothetical protein
MIQVSFHAEDMSVMTSEICVLEDDDVTSAECLQVTANAVRARFGVIRRLLMMPKADIPGLPPPHW